MSSQASVFPRVEIKHDSVALRERRVAKDCHASFAGLSAQLLEHDKTICDRALDHFLDLHRHIGINAAVILVEATFNCDDLSPYDSSRRDDHLVIGWDNYGCC